MPKESFEQFVKRQEKKLDKAEKMVKEVEERWKEKIEEEKLSEKLSEKIEEVYDEKKQELVRKNVFEDDIYSSIQKEILPKIPKIPPSLLEKILQKLTRRKKNYFYVRYFTILLCALINRTIEEYIEFQKKKGKELKEIKPLEVHLNLLDGEQLFTPGYKNPEKSHVLIRGDVNWCAGARMTGGKVVIEGNTNSQTGQYMTGGILEIKGEVKSFDKSAFSPNNKGTIIWKGIEIWRNGGWTKEGKEMWERGEIPVEG